MILTTKQAIEYLTREFRAKLNVATLTIEINDRVNVDTHEHLVKYYAIVDKYGDTRFNNKKIAEIKELRESIPGLSLVSSKCIIEQYNDVQIKKYIEDNNTLLGFNISRKNSMKERILQMLMSHSNNCGNMMGRDGEYLSVEIEKIMNLVNSIPTDEELKRLRSDSIELSWERFPEGMGK